MQYSWAIACVVVLLVGSCAAGIVIYRSKMLAQLGRDIQIATTISIFGVLLHNIFWERQINEMASKGWTLLYTIPAFLVCILVSGLLAIAFTVRSRRFRSQVNDSLIAEENPQAEQDASGNRR
jgi:hypothetical protein